MRQSPIYNYIDVPDRVAAKSFGATLKGFTQLVQVGTSKTNSHRLANIEVKTETWGGSVYFTLYVDDVPIKSGRLVGTEFFHSWVLEGN